MDTAGSSDLRYPIGKFDFSAAVTPGQRAEAVDAIAQLPGRLRSALAGMSDAQLDTPYRPGGWSVRQVVHHVPESHMNSYIRCKLALTEDSPIIKPYDEDACAKLPDAAAPIAPSLDLLDALHRRWVVMLRAISDEQWQRTYKHPDRPVPTRLDTNLALYAWHGRHHLAHIMELKKRMGW